MCDKHHDTSTTTVAETPAPKATASGCCGGHVTAPAVPPALAHGDLAECPVMPGRLVNRTDAEAAGLYRDHNGERYWFCCAACGPIWDADPEKYAAA